jgi:hypothetical protein
MTVTDDGQAQPAVSSFERYFWSNGTAGLVQLDLTPSESRSTAEQTGYGTTSPPTRFAADTGGAFAGPATWFPQRSAAGTFTVYADRLCEAKVP